MELFLDTSFSPVGLCQASTSHVDEGEGITFLGCLCVCASVHAQAEAFLTIKC